MAVDPAILDHKAWIGYLQPDGLVVSPTALVDAQLPLNRSVAELQERFRGALKEDDRDDKSVWSIPNLADFLTDFLEWPRELLAGASVENPIPGSLKVPLSQFGETLEPTFALRDPDGTDENPWILLVLDLPAGMDLDTPIESAMAGWSASHTRRFERLLRETGVAVGLISNGEQVRLIYAPKRENSGTLTFRIADMLEVAGRRILSAFELLLSGYRLVIAPTEARLPALLKKSRDYQSRVSAELAGQVLDALYELLRGFQSANERAHGELLKEVLARDPDEVYRGLLTVLMRLVFLLYAEDRGLMPGSDLYVRNYAVRTLFERLRNDAEQYPDTMDFRFGAWPQLLALFRVLFEGCEHPYLNLPPRAGHLFEPTRFRFLEGAIAEKKPPLVSDGVIHRVLEKLIMLDGERLSYRTLDVEQIGSVYETMMGFRLLVTEGLTVAMKPNKAHGAPVPIGVEELLCIAAGKRGEWLKEKTDYKMPAGMAGEVKAAKTADELLAALDRRIARNATPQPLPTGSVTLMPTDERRKSGSHYTPRTLTEPIVRTTLEPILKQLGEKPTPEDILGLKVCDPAMGSGAFLVEACRQLADELVKAWAAHGYKPSIPPDETEFLFASRIIAQRCLYGVDRNPMAVDLAKLSLWLATLAKDHPFTFLDHSFRCGDSLVGLTRNQIAAFHWAPSGALGLLEGKLRDSIESASRARRQILSAGDEMPPPAKAKKLEDSERALEFVRQIGDAAIAAFFAADKDRKREEARAHLFHQLELRLTTSDQTANAEFESAIAELRSGEKPVVPFHWEIEFPEVFAGERPGFDAIVGNPPFAGKNTIAESNADQYPGWLHALHADSHGNADLVAHFFRRTFHLVHRNGAFGLIATNTIGQGDTRATGLRWICTNGAAIYSAQRRIKWPGQAAVVVSVVHIKKGEWRGPRSLDGMSVPDITAYLFHAGGHENPTIMVANSGKSFIGSYVLGMGFTFDDTDAKGIASPLAEMERLISMDSKNKERIFPYLGGEEVNSEPTQRHHRYVINFESMSEAEARNGWPDLMRVVETRVKPERAHLISNVVGRKRAEVWWQYGSSAKDLYSAISGHDKVLAISRVGQRAAFTFLPTGIVFAETLVLFPLATHAAFAALQTRPHEIWARFFGSSMKDDLRYTPSDCFETFPFPRDFETSPALEAAGKEYYDFRAALMVKNNEGLTKTYNRFHDPGETSAEIARLRELHAAMDRAVLDAYGWTDLQPTCDFILDYEDDEGDDEGTSRRRKPWRYRWPDDIRDEVLARLLKLNAERAEEERLAGTASAGKLAKKTGRKTQKSSSASAGPLFEPTGKDSNE